MPGPNPLALAAYRGLLRAQSRTFQGDPEMLLAGRKRLKEEFLKRKDETDPAVLETLYKEAENARKFLGENVVQARLNNKGRYVVDGAKLDPTKIEGL